MYYNKDIESSLINNILDKRRGIKEIDSSLVSVISYNYSKDDFEKNIIKDRIGRFFPNSGEPDDYYKYNINLMNHLHLLTYSFNLDNTVDNKKYLNKLIYMRELAKNNKMFLNCYANNLKISDKDICVYPTTTSINIFIPIKYFDLTLNNQNIILEIKKNKKFSYINRHITDPYTSVRNMNNKSNIQFYLSETELLKKNNNGTIDINNIIVFVDGKRKFHNALIFDQNINRNIIGTKNDNEINIEINEILSSDQNIEIYIDEGIVGIKKKEFINPKDIIFAIENDLVNINYHNLFGPFDKKSCSFYLNEVYINPKKIDQIGRVHFDANLNMNFLEYNEGFVVINDDNIENNNFSPIYHDDYYLYNMFGVERITDLLNNLEFQSFDDILDHFKNIDKSKIFKKYESDFKFKNLTTAYYEEIKSLDYVFENVPWKTRILWLCLRYPYLISEYISNFTLERKKFELYIEIDGIIGDWIILPINIPSLENINIVFELFINGDLKSYVFNEIKNELSINKKDLIDGINYIEIRYHKCETNETFSDSKSPIQSEYFTFSEMIQTPVRTYSYKSNHKFNIEKLSDIIILEKIKSDGSINFFKETEGYIIPSEEFDISIDDNNHIIITTMHDISNRTFVIYNRNFVYEFSGDLYNTIDTDFNDNGIIKLKDKMGLPIIPKGNIYISCYGKKMYENSDYVFKTPLIEDICISILIIRRKKLFNTNNLFMVMVSNIINKKIGYQLKSDESNTKGLIYINDKVPYNPKYIDIYANDKKVNPNNINKISNNLIRLINTKVPLNEIYIETSFNENYDEGFNLRIFIDFFYSKYNSSFEDVVKQLFISVNYGNTKYSKNSSSYYYEQLRDNVDELGSKVDNVRKTGDEKDIFRYNTAINAYLKRINNGMDPGIFHNGDFYLTNFLLRLFSIHLDSNKTIHSMELPIGRKNYVSQTYNFGTHKNYFNRKNRLGMITKQILKFDHGERISLTELSKYLAVSNIGNRVRLKDIQSISTLEKINSANIIFGIRRN